MNSIIKNDTVQVIRGNERGKKGKVLKVVPAENKIIVEGVNFIKRHTKANPQSQKQGGIIEKEAPIQMSNALVVCDKCGQPMKTGIKMLEDRKKIRYCKKCGEVLEAKQE